MRSAGAIANELCDGYPDSAINDFREEIGEAIRIAQVDAAEWMREEAAKMAETCFTRAHTYSSENAEVYRTQDYTQALIGTLIRTIKLPYQRDDV